MAEDTLRDTLVSALESTEPEVTPEVTPEPAQETAAEARARDEQGRFAAKAEVAQPVAEVAQPVAERPQRPSSWKKDYWDHWDKLDPQVAKYIHQREQEFASGVSTYKQEAERAKQIWEAIAPYQHIIEQEQATPAEAISNLLRTASALRTADPQTKAQMLMRVAQQYGVPLEYMQGEPTGGDPQTAWLREQVQQLQGQWNNFQSQQERAAQSQINAEIESFKGDAPHFEEVREQMAGLLRAGLANDLKDAYRQATRMRDDLYEAEIESRLKASQSQQHVQRAKAAAVSVRSSTPGAMASDAPKGLRDQLREQAEQFLGSGRV